MSTDCMELANDLIRRTANRYAACRTYRDKGYVIDGDERIEFETSFVRSGNKLLLVWQSSQCVDGSVSMILCREQIAFSSYHSQTPQWQKEPNIQFALNTAAGASNGVSLIVPTLLMPDETTHCRSLLTLPNWVVLVDDMHEIMSRPICLNSSDERCQTNIWLTPEDLTLIGCEEDYVSSVDQEVESFINNFGIDAQGATNLSLAFRQQSREDLRSHTLVKYESFAFDEDIDDDAFDNLQILN